MPPLRSKREGWLLALLILRHGQEVSRDGLAQTLWPDNAEEQALFYLRKALSNVRKALGEEGRRLLSPSARTLRFDIDEASIDVVAFDEAVKGERLEEAAAIYRGGLLPDCPEEWAAYERDRREAEYQAALEKLAAKGEAAEAVRWLRLLIASDPFRESAYRSLMQALADCGDGAAITAVYRELQDRLYRDLNTEPSAETDALYHRLIATPRPVAPLPSIERPESGRHLPVPLSELVGREAVIEEILGWMRSRRLVSLVGAGGIGKTRLSIACAEAALPNYADGVWFVDLAALSDASLVPLAVARTLGVPEDAARPVMESLSETLKGRQMLIVLDNCEHLIAACAELAFRLLSACPDVSILATSRQALAVSGEQVYRVPSLQLPASGETNPSDSEAVRLFVDRAQRVSPGFALNGRNAEDIAEICRELDGIALAIEMAAARMRSLSPKEVRTRLNDRFRLLKSGNRGALPRQHTLRAAIDWSYDQLPEAEQNLLRIVSVFSGGFTLASAAALAEEDVDEVEETLVHLVDKSLVIAEPREDGTRYRMLETVRQYGQFRLAEAEEEESLRLRHRDYFIDLAFEVKPKLMAEDQAYWFSVLEAEHDNLRQALALCAQREDGGVPGLRLSGSLSRFWMIRAYFTEGRERFNIALSHPGAQIRTPDRAITLNGAGLLAWRQSDYPKAEALYAESIDIAREVESLLDVARGLNNLALITRDQGRYEEAREMHAESVEIFREKGERLIAAICLSNLAVVDHYQGDFASARAAYEENLATQRELGDRSSVTVTLSSLGAVAIDQGDLAFARTCHEEGLAIAEEIADEYWTAAHLYGLGRVADGEGDLDRGWSLITDSLKRVQALGEKTQITDHLAALASVARKSGQTELAVRLFAARTALRAGTGSPLPLFAQRQMDEELAELRSALGEEAFNAGWAEGTGWSLEEAIDKTRSA